MPKKSKLTLTPIASDEETLGQRLARVRKEHGLSQVALAERTGLIQVLVSDYERGKLRLPAEMAIRFAEALGVTTDELLQPRKKSRAEKTTKQPSIRLVRRMEQIESLPLYQQRALLTTIDAFLGNAAE
jgi:transcriptional regulator with XRE-family HTH domain